MCFVLVPNSNTLKWLKVGSLYINDMLLEASQKYEDSVTYTINCEKSDKILLQASGNMKVAFVLDL